jgi:nitrite reductase/ring-hydroxylating ferredoxin subunit
LRWSDLPNAPAPGTVVALLHELADGGALFWSQGDGKQTFRLIVLRSSDEVFGFVNRCAHFGVPLADKVEQLIFKPGQSISCNVHYARYGWRDGRCENGDCDGESLLPVPLNVRDGAVVINAP